MDMNTCWAGAPFTTRSKRGSAGLPPAFGISALSGGSNASRAATDWFGAGCFVALRMRRICRELDNVCTAENFPGRPGGIAQSLRKAARRAERDDERETQGQISSHVFSGLSV